MQTKPTSSPTLLTKAKEGNTQALAQLMGGPLKAKGIKVNVDRKGRLLFVSLVGQQCPPKQASLAFLRQGLEKLGLSRIDSIRVSGYQAGEYHPLWVERMVLNAGTGHYRESLYKRHPDTAAAAGAHSPLAPPAHSPQPKGNELKKSLLILGSLLLALLVLGLLIRAVTGPSAPPNITPLPQTTEQSEGNL